MFRIPYPANGSCVAVLGLDPIRHAYKLQDRIDVQLQQAQLQKRIKVWEVVDLWASLYQKKSLDAEHLLEQLGLTHKRDTWFMNLSGGQKQRLFIALALINDPEVVSRRADHRVGPIVATGDLGSGVRHPRARQDRLFDHSFDGGGRAVVRPGGHHRARTDHRHQQAGEARWRECCH